MRLNHLPQRCYTTRHDGEVVLIINGMDGYFPSESRTDNPINSNSMNEILGVSKVEEDVMVGGSMFGWDTPLVQDFINVREDEAQESLALSREMDHINGYQ
jgi:hypothetical protein